MGTRGILYFQNIIVNIEQHPRYAMRDGVLYFKNAVGDPVVAVPGSLSKGRRVTEIAIDQAHRIVGHKAARKTRDCLARWYWWPSMAKDVEAFCKSCGKCQTTNTSTLKPKGSLRTLRTSSAPWSSIAMDFVGPPLKFLVMMTTLYTLACTFSPTACCSRSPSRPSPRRIVPGARDVPVSALESSRGLHVWI